MLSESWSVWPNQPTNPTRGFLAPVWCRPAPESGRPQHQTALHAESNFTNRTIFVSEHRIRLRPRYLKDVQEVDTRTTVQGEEITAPICISPTGFHCLVWPDGEMSTARGMTQPHLEALFSGALNCAGIRQSSSRISSRRSLGTSIWSELRRDVPITSPLRLRKHPFPT